MSIEKAKDLTAPASLSAEVIEEGLRLLKRATPGGWQMKNDYDDHIIIGDVDLDAEGDVTCTEILELCDVDRSHCNGELILWMYAHLPALLAAAREREGMRALLVEAEPLVSEREFLDTLTFSYGSGYPEPSPAEWGISACYQQSFDAGPKDQFDAAVLTHHQRNAEECDTEDQMTLTNRIRAALQPSPAKGE